MRDHASIAEARKACLIPETKAVEAALPIAFHDSVAAMMAKIGRNDPCTCGSGRKYKRCCGEERVTGGSGKATPVPLQQLAGLANAGRYAELEQRAGALLARMPQSGELWRLMSLALWMQGKDALAALQQAAQLLPRDAEAQGNLGTALRTRGRLEEARACYGRALQIAPDYVEAHNNLGSVLRDLGQLKEAIASYGRALALDPKLAIAHCNLGDAYLLLGRLDDAAASCRKALALDPNLSEAHNNLAMVLRQKGEAEQALSFCRRALQINPQLTLGWILLAQLQADQGEFGAAEISLRRAIAIDADSAEAWAAIPALRKMTLDDAAWREAALRVAAVPLPLMQSAKLHFALGKYYDDVRDFAAAFEHYREANELSKRQRSAHEQPAVVREMDEIIAAHGRAWFERTRAGANASLRPIFIVGMPRSGTTLSEQILNAHPEIFGAGELHFWNSALAEFRSARRDAGDEVSHLRRLAGEYLELLETLSPHAARVCDKLPANFRCLGLIHAAFPAARIIHMQRDPIDTCLSIYFQDFHALNSYASDLHDLAHYYGEYARLMSHWRAVLPDGVMLEVPYEGLTEQPEAWSRKLVDFVGLPWDSRCLDFTQTSRTILTFSKWQARQRISSASVARWRNYQQYLGPLLALRQHAPVFPA